MADQQLTIREVLALIIPLTDDDLLAAREEAKALVLKDIGDPPTPENFMRTRAQRIPRWLTVLIATPLALAMLAAFLMSLFRVFTAGRDLFLLHIDDPIQAAIAGIATFMLAELLVVGSMLAMTIYFTGWKRLLMLATALMGVLVALTANIVVSKPADWWGWLDAVAPPLAVLLISLAFEAMLISSVRERQKAMAEYQVAIDEWKNDTSKPESALVFHNRYYPNAIKRRLKLVNSNGTGSQRRKEIMEAMRPEHWNVIVTRELKASDWFDAQKGNQMLEHGDMQGAEVITINPNGHGGDPRPLALPPQPMPMEAAVN
jgi:hypothetical protein